MRSTVDDEQEEAYPALLRAFGWEMVMPPLRGCGQLGRVVWNLNPPPV